MKYLLPNLILAVILYAVLIYAFLDVMKNKEEIKQLNIDKQDVVKEKSKTFESLNKNTFYFEEK